MQMSTKRKSSSMEKKISAFAEKNVGQRDQEERERMKSETSASGTFVTGEDLAPSQFGLQPLDETILKEVAIERGGENNLMGLKDILNSGTREVPLDQSMIARIEDSVDLFPFIQTCISRIDAAVLENGISFSNQAGSPIETRPEFRSIVDTFYTNFVHDALRVGHKIGLIPVAVGVFLESKLNAVPYVPADNTYMITVAPVRGMRKYNFYWIRQSQGSLPGGSSMYERDDKVRIYTFPGCAPTIHGKLRSRFACVTEQIEEYILHRKCHVTADVNNSNPTNYTALESKLASNPDLLVNRLAPYADAIDSADPGSVFIAETSIEALQKIDARNSRDAAFGLNLVEEPDVVEMKNRIDIAKRLRMAQQNVVPLPFGRHLERADRAEFNPMLPSHASHLQNLIFNVLLVPSSIINHESTVRGNVTGQNKTLEDNVKMLAGTLSGILTEVYEAVYGYEEKLDIKKIVTANFIAALINLVSDEKKLIALHGKPQSTEQELQKPKRQTTGRRILQSFMHPDTDSARHTDFDYENKAAALKLDRDMSDFLLREIMDDGRINLYTERAYDSMRVHVVLQAIPTVDPSLLTFAHARGLITYRKYAEVMLKLLGLRLNDLAEKNDILDKDQRVELMLNVDFESRNNETEERAKTKVKLNSVPKKLE
jgi:hypothetical protein